MIGNENVVFDINLFSWFVLVILLGEFCLRSTCL